MHLSISIKNSSNIFSYPERLELLDDGGHEDDLPREPLGRRPQQRHARLGAGRDVGDRRRLRPAAVHALGQAGGAAGLPSAFLVIGRDRLETRTD